MTVQDYTSELQYKIWQTWCFVCSPKDGR